MTWVTRAVTAPAKMAPHETWLSRTARVSAAARWEAGVARGDAVVWMSRCHSGWWFVERRGWLSRGGR